MDDRITTSKTMNAHEHLVEIAQSAGRIFQGLLVASLGNSNPEGTCLYASALVQKMIEQFTPWRSIIRGGGPLSDTPNTGVRVGDQWRGHYWVESHTPEGDFIVDITAGQFGFEPVRVLRVEDELSYCAADQAETDQGIAEKLEDLNSS